MAWVPRCREPPYLTLGLTLDRKAAEHLLGASTSQSRQEFLYSLDRWENGSRTNDVTCPRWPGQTHRMQRLEGPQRACPKAPVMELHGGYILSLTRVKDPQTKSQHLYLPTGLRPASQITQAQSLETCLLQGSWPLNDLLPGFLPSSKS